MSERETIKDPVRFWKFLCIVAAAAAVLFAVLWAVSLNTEKEPEEEWNISDASGEHGEPEEAEQTVTEVPGANELDVSSVDITGKKVIVDAGHGKGLTSGTTSISGRPEHEINLEISKKIEALLNEEGADVVMMRKDEYPLDPNWDLDMQAREQVIRDSNADFYLNVHQNEFKDNPDACGPQVFFLAQGTVGKKLAVCIQDEMNYELEIENPRMALEQHDRLLKTGSQPSVTIECGFLSNAGEDKLLQDDAYQQRVAQSIVDGVKLYVKKYG